MFTDFRIKFLRFFRKNKIIIFMVICIFVIVILINKFLKSYEPITMPETSYEPHTSVMDSEDTVTDSTASQIENLIEKYVNYCNEADYASAYNMLSDNCKNYEFDNNLSTYMSYVYTKMPTEKKYAIQDYSNDGNLYIYQVKYTDDLLKTGLTNSTYSYTEEKIVFKKTTDGIEMSVGNFIDYSEIKKFFENEYLKVDVKSVVKYYSVERYEVKFTNRTNYTIVISDSQEDNEVALELNSSDDRSLITAQEIIIEPNSSKTLNLEFTKFYDNDDNSTKLKFNTIRVMEKYSGTENVSEETIESEKENAIAKFGVNINLN